MNKTKRKRSFLRVSQALENELGIFIDSWEIGHYAVIAVLLKKQRLSIKYNIVYFHRRPSNKLEIYDVRTFSVEKLANACFLTVFHGFILSQTGSGFALSKLIKSRATNPRFM